MAYYDEIQLVANDTKPEVNLTLKDANTAASGLTLDPDDSSTWAPIDLSDPIIRVKFRALGGSSILDTMTCIKVAVAAGTYEGEIELTYTTGAIWTLFDRLKFKVRADF